jgi:hypothetical protein
MKTLQLITLALLTALYSCESNKIKDKEMDKQKDKKVDVFDFKMPIVIETSNTERSYQSTTGPQFGNYNPLYIGKRMDSLSVSYRPNLEKYFVYDENRRRYGRPDSAGIVLLIDTTRIISNHSLQRLNDARSLSTNYFNDFPVFVVNTTKDTLRICSGNSLPIIMEAQDNKGAWRPIEEEFFLMCGTGINSVILPPNEILITSAPIYKGTFKTKLRLRYNRILSNEFYGTINPTQFKPLRDDGHNRSYEAIPE